MTPFEKALAAVQPHQRYAYPAHTKVKIWTDPSTTKKGNKTCPICLKAKKDGTPLPPQHPNCRCKSILTH